MTSNIYVTRKELQTDIEYLQGQGLEMTEAIDFIEGLLRRYNKDIIIADPLKCPNCELPLKFEGQTKFKGEKYDEWLCDECSHVVVLDFRGE